MKVFELENCHQMKPLINGKEIAELLNRKQGSWLKDILRDIIEYQIANPSCNKDDILAFISDWKG